jgi:hypothetical protein
VQGAGTRAATAWPTSALHVALGGDALGITDPVRAEVPPRRAWHRRPDHHPFGLRLALETKQPSPPSTLPRATKALGRVPQRQISA